MPSDTQPDKKQTSSAQDRADTTTRFGSRMLATEDNVFEHNAWDHVEWSEEQEQLAQEKIALQQANPVPHDEQGKYHQDAADYWNQFYQKNENRFFKDRHWLRIEFPELFDRPANQTHRFNVLENHPNYDPSRGQAFVWDLASANLPKEIEPHSLDVVILVFVFSALHPDHWDQAVANLEALLRPGGMILFRDYGRHDLAQLRFKKQRLLADNFYIRGDGTRVYFFTNDEIEKIFGTLFAVKQNAVDKRLIVNRHKKLKMYRVWLQGKFQKPFA
ncbi:hypothetical protein H4R34_001695 [Dimargaris verticillata]|uniref:tRNA N(3)-methylcytidine methyltransferase n=1 Tax=Dimargaris verticillata TaxID=2761393 RepID=A0A9W8B7Y3_9FUNG|nr:hypothetical protein H4R34_001695 [Dimargaris verticillata]